MPDPANHFAELEAMTGHPLPAAWLALIRQFPPTLAQRKYPGLTDRVADHELLDDVERVLMLNRFIREEPVWGDDEDEDAPWQNTRLAIGKDISGDIVFLDTSRAEPPVQRFLVSSGRVIEMAPNIATFARILDTPDVVARRI